MLRAEFVEVLATRDRDDFRDRLIAFARRLGFDTVGAMFVVDHAANSSEFFNFDNTPPEFREIWSNHQRNMRDPVAQHCKRQSVPIAWNQSTYVGKGMGDLWEEQAQFGYRTGISLALHMPNGKHFMIGVDRDQPLPQDCGELTRMVADLQLFAVHANEAASRVLLTAGTGQRELHENLECLLSPREKECLKWTLEGKTAWEIGMILSISDRTVAQHLGRSMQKLDAVGKHQAALRAQRLGWI